MKKIWFGILLWFPVSLFADEGMHPITEIARLKLREKGLELDAAQIFNMDSASLAHAVVMVGGCTGSFVSPEGLILTNHHCAFGAVQRASSVDHDYIRDGFLAKSRDLEIPAIGYTVRITESFKDVSAEVLSAVNDDMDFIARNRAISAQMRAIAARAQAEMPGRSADVSEMVIGQKYVLFLYTLLRDIRLVYVPPRSIGEFGGEEDNWIWPRHTGDFSFMRAYVSPNGEAAEYSVNNVPYNPKRFLKVQYEGVDENDFVFILGYPGRTMRHRTAEYIEFEQDFRLKYVADLFEWQIATMEALGREDRAVAIQLASRIKGLANVKKNYRGKIQGLRRLNLVEKFRKDDEELQAYIMADKDRQLKYGHVIGSIAEIYAEMKKRADYEYTLDYLKYSVNLLRMYDQVLDAGVELQKPDSERSAPYKDARWSQTSKSWLSRHSDMNEQVDQAFLTEMFYRAARLPRDQRIAPIDEVLRGATSRPDIEKIVSKMYEKSKIRKSSDYEKILSKSGKDLSRLSDPMAKLMMALRPLYTELENTRDRQGGALNLYYGLYAEAKQAFQQADFIPDANRTLRLTYGRIRGYSPSDATTCTPITTATGILQKTTYEEPYDTPKPLIDLIRKGDFGIFKHKRLNNLPVGILYNTDTTGGNSGSPVLNAKGELIGLNFDRTYEATVNDYAWTETYSRSIGVDIRYVLWVTQKYAGASQLLKEMNVPVD